LTYANCVAAPGSVIGPVESLEITVTADGQGPVVALSGEADTSNSAELSAALTRQVEAGPQHLTVDLSGLLFADSASIRELIVASRALRARGGTLELVNPQHVVARSIHLLGVEHLLGLRAEAVPGSEPGEA
jgi:anti-anti-sigma factor